MWWKTNKFGGAWKDKTTSYLLKEQWNIILYRWGNYKQVCGPHGEGVEGPKKYEKRKDTPLKEEAKTHEVEHQLPQGDYR